MSKLILSLMSVVFQIHYLKISRIYELTNLRNYYFFKWLIIRELVKKCHEQLIDNHHESLEFLIKSEQTILSSEEFKYTICCWILIDFDFIYSVGFRLHPVIFGSMYTRSLVQRWSRIWGQTNRKLYQHSFQSSQYAKPRYAKYFIE